MRAVWIGVAAVAIACGDNGLGLLPAASDGAADNFEVTRTPTYYREVAPILEAHCTGCHREGGAAPFTLTSQNDAVTRSGVIAAVTSARVMPPWPADASGDCNTFIDQRWLTDDQIATLEAWNAAGAPAGDGRDQPFVVAKPPATAFTTSVELGSPVPYGILPGPDEYRCFVVDPGLATDRYITALAMQLDRADVVHHMQLYAADSAADEQVITARDALDPLPGYDCDSEGPGQGLRYVGVWAAGNVIHRWPTGTGIRLRAGHRLVVQLHYHNHGSELVADHTRVALELADTVDLVARIDSAAGYPLVLPPGQPDVTVTGVKPLPLARPGFVRAVRIHMHELGTRARMQLVRAGETTCLLDIPRWDFGWQLFYTFTEPIAVQPYDDIRITCSYDTTSRSDTVTWGTATEDEMCLAYSLLTD